MDTPNMDEYDEIIEASAVKISDVIPIRESDRGRRVGFRIFCDCDIPNCSAEAAWYTVDVMAAQELSFALHMAAHAADPAAAIENLRFLGAVRGVDVKELARRVGIRYEVGDQQ